MWLSAACAFHPWAEDFWAEDGQRMLPHERPNAHPDDCLACDTVKLQPGTGVRRRSVFNGTFWGHAFGPGGAYDPGSGRELVLAARPGTYAWRFGLSMWKDGGCQEGGGYLAAYFDVTVR